MINTTQYSPLVPALVLEGYIFLDYLKEEKMKDIKLTFAGKRYIARKYKLAWICILVCRIALVISLVVFSFWLGFQIRDAVIGICNFILDLKGYPPITM